MPALPIPTLVDAFCIPDAAVVTAVHPSPNHGERRDGRRPDMLLLHYTGMASAEAALHRLCSPEAGVSAHYFVFEDGRTIQLVPENRRAWHAGAGRWAGETDINSCSIGIEIAHPGHAGGLPPYPREQMAAVIDLCRDIVGRWQIPPERVLAHSDVAPSRKEDPGELFPWRSLHEAGVGRYVEPAPLRQGDTLRLGAAGPDVAALQTSLSAYGYDLPVTGVYDDATASVVTAFQRHFRPARVDAVADASTVETLRCLLTGCDGAGSIAAVRALR